MSLANYYNKLANEQLQEDDLEKVASENEATVTDTQEDLDQDEMVKIASQYTNLGRQMARRDYEAFEKIAQAELENAGVEIPVDPKDEILAKMQSDPEYAQSLIAKHAI